MMLRHHTELTRALSKVSTSTLMHSTPPEWLEEKFYRNKTVHSTSSNRKAATWWDSSCSVLLPRYLPGPSSAALCGTACTLYCLFALVTRAMLLLPGKPSCPSREELPGSPPPQHPPPLASTMQE